MSQNGTSFNLYARLGLVALKKLERLLAIK
jgi:hypothetical protein